MVNGRPVAGPAPSLNEASFEAAQKQPEQTSVVASVEESAQNSSLVNTGMRSSIQQKNSSLMYTNFFNSILLTIPPFDGKPEEYAVFRQQFDRLVHEKDEIPDTLKHVLLLKLLTGDLKERMRSTNISAPWHRNL